MAPQFFWHIWGPKNRKKWGGPGPERGPRNPPLGDGLFIKHGISEKIEDVNFKRRVFSTFQIATFFIVCRSDKRATTLHNEVILYANA